mgnify:CR=1 FL=1
MCQRPDALQPLVPASKLSANAVSLVWVVNSKCAPALLFVIVSGAATEI